MKNLSPIATVGVLRHLDISALISWCYKTWYTDLEDVVVTLRKELGDCTSDVEHAMVLFLLVHYGEKLARRQHGMSLTNCPTPADRGFYFMGQERKMWLRYAHAWVKEAQQSAPALQQLADAQLANGLFMKSAETVKHLRAVHPRDLQGVTHMEAEFFTRLDVAAVESQPTIRRTVYVACDGAFYEKYGRALVKSWRDNTDIALAFEVLQDHPHGKNHYHVVRYLRFRNYLRDHPSTAAYMIDADLLFNRPAADLFTLLDGHDVALHMQPGRPEVRNQINASVVGIAPTAGGRQYLETVAAYIEACLERTSWGLDQVGLYCTWENLRPDTVCVPAQIYSGEKSKEAVLWPGK